MDIGRKIFKRDRAKAVELIEKMMIKRFPKLVDLTSKKGKIDQHSC